METGDKVIFDGQETHIEKIHGDGTCTIANPNWDWDEEAECVKNKETYDMPYWLTVNLSQLIAVK